MEKLQNLSLFSIPLSMEIPDDRFRAWMDEKKLLAETVGKALDVSPQTIRNWRASGIPKRRHEAVRRLMREWDFKANAQIGSRLSISASDKQFRSWNAAALAEGMLIEDWARDGLDQLAQENDRQPKTHLKVADASTNYDSESSQK